MITGTKSHIWPNSQSFSEICYWRKLELASFFELSLFFAFCICINWNVFALINIFILIMDWMTNVNRDFLSCLKPQKVIIHPCSSLQLSGGFLRAHCFGSLAHSFSSLTVLCLSSIKWHRQIKLATSWGTTARYFPQDLVELYSMCALTVEHWHFIYTGFFKTKLQSALHVWTIIKTLPDWSK